MTTTTATTVLADPTNDLSDTAARAAAIEMDDPPATPAKVVKALRNAPRARRAGEVDPEAAARCKADEELARASGFSPKPPIYAIGSRVNEIGVENFRASRAKFENMMLAVTALELLRDRVRSEDRQGVVVAVKDLFMTDAGMLVHNELGTMTLAESGFERFAYDITPNGGRYLCACPSVLRAYNFNHWVADSRNADREVMLRHRTNPAGGREVFAAVSPTYAAHDIDQIAEQAIEALPAGARAEVTYDGARARINVVFHSDINPERAAAGEIFKAAAAITTDDTGRGSIRTEAELWRNLCLNLIILDRSKVKTGARRHVKGATIAEDVRAGFDRALAAVGGFADKWNQATAENVIERYEADGIEAIFKGLVHNKLVWAPGVGSVGMVERLQRAWDVEPGYTKSAVVNAITRAAHEEPWNTPWVTEDLERQAGQLLYAKVWNVALPETDAQ